MKLARNEAIQQVLVYCNKQYKDYEIEKLAITNVLCSDADDSCKSVFSDATDLYYLPKEAELFTKKI